MRSKIKRRFNELSTAASLIIKHGMQISCLLMSMGLVIHLLNIYSNNYRISQSSLSKYIIEAAVTIAAEVIIGGLMFDHYFKKHNAE